MLKVYTKENNFISIVNVDNNLHTNFVYNN